MNLTKGVELKRSTKSKQFQIKHVVPGKGVIRVAYHIVVALLLRAPNNSNCLFEPDRLEGDHFTEGEEGKTVEMSLSITNLQFLTKKQNNAKFTRWKTEIEKEKRS